MLNIFGRTPKTMKAHVTMGQYCPKCEEDGGLFFYKGIPESYYMCENCLIKFSELEYINAILKSKIFNNE